MLDQDHADRRQLRDLMASETPGQLALVRRVLAPAAAAHLRKVIHDLINLILGPERPTHAAMPRLTACLAILTRQLLRPRPRLRPTLLTRLRRIRRRRHRTRPRIPPRLLLQPPQPLLVPLHPGREIEDELHANIPPRVIVIS